MHTKGVRGWGPRALTCGPPMASFGDPLSFDTNNVHYCQTPEFSLHYHVGFGKSRYH